MVECACGDGVKSEEAGSQDDTRYGFKEAIRWQMEDTKERLDIIGYSLKVIYFPMKIV